MVLCFGVVRPYKGVETLLEAIRSVPNGELWVVGRPLGVAMDELRALAGPRVRFVSRYVSDAELPAYFRRADVVALPHREVDVSGVLFTGLAFGKAMAVSGVGGFAELGIGRLVTPADDPAAWAAALTELLERPEQRGELEAAARAAAAGPYSWDAVAERTLALYASLREDSPA